MRRKTFMNSVVVASLMLAMPMASTAKTWTLEECIQYAMENNISLQKSGLTKKSSHEDVAQARAQLFPSLNFGTNQNMTYRPWQYSGTAMVADGQVQASVDKVYYNGSYNLNANWTVWNGNRNRNTVKRNEIAEQQAAVDSVTTAKNLQEQIAQLYLQILYTKESIGVCKASLEAARTNEERGRTMFEVGTMSKADLSQLTATRAQDEYNVVQAESQARSYTRQLKQLLQITSQEEFDVVMIPGVSDAMAMEEIPDMMSVYEAAVEKRPEMKSAKLAMQSAEIQKKIAAAMRMPTVSMNASVGTNTNTMSKNGWGDQMKTNLNVGAGFTVSVPILEQRQKRTAVNKATLMMQQAQLDEKERATALYSTIENYWIQAENYQNQFKSAKVSTQSAQDSYDLLSEQFAVGLKNIAELQEGKARLLQARQNELQSKFMSILNIKMLEFYKN